MALNPITNRHLEMSVYHRMTEKADTMCYLLRNKNMLHSNQENAHWHFVVVFFIALSSCYVFAESWCSAIENNYYNKTLNVCVLCKECRNGKARNFSEQVLNYVFIFIFVCIHLFIHSIYFFICIYLFI